MRKSNATGRCDVQNALWGSGNRGSSGTRSSALWGKGGRVLVTTAVAAVTLGVPFASATASGPTTSMKAGKSKEKTWIYPGLLDKAKKQPGEMVRVIIQSSDGASGAENAFKGLPGTKSLKKRLNLVGAVAVEVPASVLPRLSAVQGLTVTPDVAAQVSALPATSQLWPGETGNASLWTGDVSTYVNSMPTIAIVDSGIDATRPGFAGRILANVNLSTLPNNSPGDGRGHGTFVAGIAADATAGYAGAAPAAKIVSLDIMDDSGMGRTSDIITACDWILQNKDKYNIRIANFSLHSGLAGNFTKDPLNKAVEKLWFSGVVVVAAAGNYGVNGQPTRVKYAPGNDPFVITVGAVDLAGTKSNLDDAGAPWSAFGYTYDGFSKPDVAAAGRYMVGPVPVTSTLVKEKPGNVVAPGYIQLSGTSFSAPVVSGTVAQILARRPSMTPDQVKGALMVSAHPVLNGDPRSAGVGEISAAAALYVANPPDPNAALKPFLTSSGGSGLTFDAASWDLAIHSNASWDAASYADASYADASWNLASYADASWDLASYADASYADASYADASYADSSYEDAAEGDAAADPSAYELGPDDLAAILADPLLAPNPATLIVDGP